MQRSAIFFHAIHMKSDKSMLSTILTSGHSVYIYTGEILNVNFKKVTMYFSVYTEQVSS